jgi:hypothetical protein
MKTSDMERIELLDWERRIAMDPSARRRDIREIIPAAFDQGGRLEEPARIVGVDTGTLSVWINKRLGGQTTSRVLFSDFDPPTAAVDER